MESNYSQVDQEIINRINWSFIEDVVVMILYILLFVGASMKFPYEDKFFLHFVRRGESVEKLVSVFLVVAISTIFLLTGLYYARRFFLQKYRHIKSNFFFLNNRWIATLNCLLKICSCIMLTISFMSLPRLLVTISFITLSSFLKRKRELEYQLSPHFFSWKDTRLLKLLIYSSVAIALSGTYRTFILIKNSNAASSNILVSKLKSAGTSLMERFRNFFSSEVKESVNEVLPEIPYGPLLTSVSKIARNVLNSGEVRGAPFLGILLFFIRSTIYNSISSFRDFWTEIAATTGRVEWFKYFANSQLVGGKRKTRNPIQEANSFPILCYSSFVLNPSFIKQGYIEKIDSFDGKFTEKIKSVGEFIRLVEQIANVKEKRFILYWLFNHITSFSDFLAYSKSVSQVCNF